MTTTIAENKGIFENLQSFYENYFVNHFKGKVFVKFNKLIENFDDSPDENMIAEIINMTLEQHPDEDPYFIIEFDFNEYIDHNKRVGKKVWYAEAGNKNKLVTLFESPFASLKNNKIELYFMATDELPFELLNADEIFSDYMEHKKENLSYIEFLEEFYQNNRFLSVVSFRMGEQIEVFQHKTLEEAKEEVQRQLVNYEEGHDIAQVYENVPNQKQPKFVCNDHDILQKK